MNQSIQQEDSSFCQGIAEKNNKNERRQSRSINLKENKENSYSSKFNKRRKNINQSFEAQIKPDSYVKTNANLRYL